MGHLLHDLRLAFRTLRRSTGFMVVTVLTLALGIGATTAVFSVVNGVLLRPLPLPEPERLAIVWETRLDRGLNEGWVSYPNFEDWQQARSFASLAAFADWTTTLSGQGDASVLRGGRVSAEFFTTLGVAPLLGRDFRRDDDAPGGGEVVLLSAGLWQRAFGGDSGVVGRSVLLDGRRHTIVGVMPPRFVFPRQPEAELWRPLAIDSARRAERGNHFFEVVGRLRSGVSLEQARAEMAVIARRLERQYPDMNAGRGTRVVSLGRQVTGEARPALLIALSAMVLVLLIACANIGSLFVARAAARASERAVRRALGASRGQLVRAALAESLIVGALGGGLGIVAAFWLVDGLVAVVPAEVPRLSEVAVDGRVLLFAVGVSAVASLAFGLLPGLRSASAEPNAAVREGGRSQVGSRRSSRRVLVAGQIALTLVLLIVASLLVRSFLRLQQVDPGFEPARLLAADVSLPQARYPTPARDIAFFDRLLRRIRAVPGVAGAAGAFGTPLSDRDLGLGFTIDGRPTPAPGQVPTARVTVVSPDYFRTLGIAVLAGAPVAERDDFDAPGVVVVNEALARRHFPDGRVVGQRIRLEGSVTPEPDRLRTIVGVVRDVRNDGPADAPAPEMYVPYAQFPIGRMTLTVRATGEASGLVGPIRETLRALDPDLALADVHTMRELWSASVARPRFLSLLLGGFAAFAVLLALLGVYGLMAYTVARRTRELGLRMALGARAADVMTLILRDGLVLAVAGAIGGTLAALAAARLLSGLLFQVAATDPLTYVAAPVLLIGAALLACWLPARRASRVDPRVALQAE